MIILVLGFLETMVIMVLIVVGIMVMLMMMINFLEITGKTIVAIQVLGLLEMVVIGKSPDIREKMITLIIAIGAKEEMITLIEILCPKEEMITLIIIMGPDEELITLIIIIGPKEEMMGLGSRMVSKVVQVI